MSKLADRFLLQIVTIGLPPPAAEYHFSPRVDGKPSRMWRFDFAWPDALVAVEIQGGTWVAGGSAGYHGSGRGIEQDAEKLNAAAALGWRVALVTSPMVSNGAGLLILRVLLGKLEPGVLFQSREKSD